jgi:hypothetical protein
LFFFIDVLLLLSKMFFIMLVSSSVGIFVYMFVMSKEYSLVLSVWIVLRLLMRLIEFFTLKALGSCIVSFSVFATNIASL